MATSTGAIHPLPKLPQAEAVLPVKILVLNYEFPPIGGGGGKASADLCATLAASGHDLRVLTSRSSGLAASEMVDGYQVIRTYSGRRSYFRASFTAMLGYLIGGLIPGYRLISSWKPDLIHVHFAVPSGVLAYLLSKATNTPYVLTLHLGDVPGGVPDKTDRWFRWVFPFTPRIYQEASAVVAVSEFTRQLALSRYPVEIMIIPNGIDLAAVHATPDTPGNPPQIVFAGRFAHQKNPHAIVRILSEVRNRDWVCTMIGDGSLLPEIKASAERLELNERFKFTGWLEQAEVMQAFQASDILLMPSRSEGLPVVGVQALAAGLAIVASDVGGFSEIVQQGINGYLFDPEDEIGMAGAVAGYLDDPGLLKEAKFASRERAARFDLKGIGEAYQELFTQVIAE
jgi:glycosyltransferase involved in cell wall biosynthesis